MTIDGVEFVYFNLGTKAFEIVKISPALAHMVIPMEMKAPVCDNPPRKIPYYRLNQSPLVIKR
jgi:hypothetical protein